jgi:DNA-binding transcriptional regulator YiaG
MENKTIPHLQTEFEGVPIEVADARVAECSACGERACSAGEVRRWKQIKQAALLHRKVLPTGADVKRVREAHGLTVADLAHLLAVTRQTVHAWERAEDEPIKSGPAALLVLLLADEIAANVAPVFRKLVTVAARRGQGISLETSVTPARGKSPLPSSRRRAV